jgi:hypothetical protein
MVLQIIARALFVSALIFCTRAACAEDIRIAVAGSLAEAGDEVKRGAEPALRDINAPGGVNGRRIVLSIEDDACDTKQAVSVANHAARLPVARCFEGWPPTRAWGRAQLWCCDAGARRAPCGRR